LRPSSDQVLEIFEAYPPELGLFMRHVRRDEQGCWRWTGSIRPNGYGSFQGASAHRVAYELFVGAIGPDLCVDHLCRVRDCVNPLHLEAVTRAENTLRGTSPAAENARKTTCKRGHPLSGENLYLSNGARSCLACRRETSRAAMRRLRATA
jgi:hypothetical protein